MAESTRPIEVGAALRALRRQADLSQRELARRSGVPKSTVARIESDPGADPRLRTVERLVRAAGGELAVGVRTADHSSTDGGPGAVAVPPPVPHDGRRDEAGRRYPAHLDIREVRTLKDWPGAWWGHWYVHRSSGRCGCRRGRTTSTVGDATSDGYGNGPAPPSVFVG
ncbi:helix-turn-helix transcriptional regulator [Micromonospora sp. NPDC023633]|uniref:helix-turn-helix domain-containing protein n=1 Tax=Micromonospora sp. NPDC023633 TaxID=3154320 RepID=UPI003411F5CB